MEQQRRQSSATHFHKISLAQLLTIVGLICGMTQWANADEGPAPAGNWKVTRNTEQRLEYILQCLKLNTSNKQQKINCPSIVVKNTKTSENYNHAYLDVIITDYRLALEKASHSMVNFTILNLGKVDTVHITSQQQDKKFEAIIAVGDKDIYYYEYTAENHHFLKHQSTFNQYWESRIAQLQ